jgi:hypothetical protein
VSSRLGFPFDHMPIWDAAVYIQSRHFNVNGIGVGATVQVAEANPNRFWLWLLPSFPFASLLLTPVIPNGGLSNDPNLTSPSTGDLFITWWDHSSLVQMAWNATNTGAGVASCCVTEQYVNKWPNLAKAQEQVMKVPPCPDLMKSIRSTL